MATIKDLKTEDLSRTFRKTLPFVYEKADDKASDPDVAGEIEGFAAGLLNIDKGEDLIFPGAFAEASTEEVIVAYQHDITSILGRPLEMQERLAPEYGLWTRSEIVATTLGADVMKLVRRKILKKMSIGYRLVREGYSMLNRDTLVSTLKDFSHNNVGIPEAKQTEILTDFDKRKLEGVFALFKVNLREYSIVTWPMNDAASITGAKDEFGSLLDGLPFNLHPALVLAANKGYVTRAKDLYTRLKQPENKSLNESHREALEIIAVEGSEVAKEARELLDAMKLLPATTSNSSDADLEARFLTLSAEIDARIAGNI